MYSIIHWYLLSQQCDQGEQCNHSQCSNRQECNLRTQLLIITILLSGPLSLSLSHSLSLSPYPVMLNSFSPRFSFSFNLCVYHMCVLRFFYLFFLRWGRGEEACYSSTRVRVTTIIIWTGNGGGFFVACKDLGRMFVHSFPACTFFFLM